MSEIARNWTVRAHIFIHIFPPKTPKIAVFFHFTAGKETKIAFQHQEESSTLETHITPSLIPNFRNSFYRSLVFLLKIWMQPFCVSSAGWCRSFALDKKLITLVKWTKEDLLPMLTKHGENGEHLTGKEGRFISEKPWMNLFIFNSLRRVLGRGTGGWGINSNRCGMRAVVDTNSGIPSVDAWATCRGKTSVLVPLRRGCIHHGLFIFEK